MEKLVVIVLLCASFLMVYCAHNDSPDHQCHESERKPRRKKVEKLVKSFFTFSDGKTEDITIHALMYNANGEGKEKDELTSESDPYLHALQEARTSRIAFKSDGSLLYGKDYLTKIDEIDNILILALGFIDDIESQHLINGIRKISLFLFLSHRCALSSLKVRKNACYR